MLVDKRVGIQKPCIVSFTPNFARADKWVLGNSFNRAFFSIYDVRKTGNRIGFIGTGGLTKLGPSIMLADTHPGGAIFGIVIAVTLGAIALLICCVCCFRACSERKHFTVPPLNMPKKPASPIYSPRPYSIVSVGPPKQAAKVMHDENDDLWCALCGRHHADMKHVTTSNLRDQDF